MRIFIAGDTHGNSHWFTEHIFPTAIALKADAIVQVGDFGYWEHVAEGVGFLDTVSRAASQSGIPLYWLHGNHDKWKLAMDKYGKNTTADGFVICRDNLFYIPNGHSWTWASRNFRAFGGAYSVDKQWRLDMERKRYRIMVAKETKRANVLGVHPRPVSTAGTLWFPEEEMTDDEMTELLTADAEPKDVVFSHDKPRSSNPSWNRKDMMECWPNQDRLQRALLVHTPLWWIHGHLHWQYVNTVRSGAHSATTVVGLAPDDRAAELRWSRWQTHAILDISADRLALTLGDDDDVMVTREELTEAARLLW